MQIGCKIIPLYDFCSSEHHLQINLFVGNKTDSIIDRFTIDYRGTNNLQVYLEPNKKIIKEMTQFKERLIVSCTNFDEDILLLIDLQSPVITLKSLLIPLSLHSFCIFSQPE